MNIDKWVNEMTNFVRNKELLLGILLHYFNMEKSAFESNRISVEVYGDHAPDQSEHVRSGLHILKVVILTWKRKSRPERQKKSKIKRWRY